MIRLSKLFLNKCIVLLVTFFAFESKMSAQETIVPQQFSGLEKLCAGASFNEFNATFSYMGFPAGTTFVVELSDPTGSFTTPIATTLLQTTEDTPTQKTIKYAIPTNLVGSDTYRLRVKASTGKVSPTNFKNSLGNEFFPAYYKDYEASFYINNKNYVATMCSGDKITITVYNPTPNNQASSPANYPNLRYRWYKDNVLIAGQSDKELVANAPGRYYAEIDYGQCSDANFSSNRVSVLSSNTGSAVTITSSLGNPFCSNGGGTILTATSGNSYIWKKNGVLISGATGRFYNTNEPGIYSVEVSFDECKATGSIDLENDDFSASVDVPEENDLAEGETLNVSVMTDAVNPKYEWFLNENSIPNATTNTYLVTIKGSYKVRVVQVSDCIDSRELFFNVICSDCPIPTSSVIPNIVKLSSHPYWDLPIEYQNHTTHVIIISSQGEIIFEGTDYDSSKWVIDDFENINPVYYYVIQGKTGEKKGSITVIK